MLNMGDLHLNRFTEDITIYCSYFPDKWIEVYRKQLCEVLCNWRLKNEIEE